METAIKKVTATSMFPNEVRTYFHAYLIKSVFFGTGVIRLTDAQAKQLRRIYEGPLLKKLGYSEKFPRPLMYVDIRHMGLGFLTPRTIVDQLQLKLLVGHNRLKTQTNELLLDLHETLQVNSGLSINIA